MTEERVLARLDKLSDDIGGIKADLSKSMAHHESIELALSEIKDQTTKTNGRVTSLETSRTRAVAYFTVIAFAVSAIFRAIA